MLKISPTIAILGSGPAGCYTAQFLRKKWPEAEITVFEALPVPYGLLRYGVATDHQGTKAIAAQFDRMFERENVRFVGNVTIGVDISFQSISDHFDIVVRATGLQLDRSVAEVMNPACKIIGAGALLKALNGYPKVSLPVTSTGQLAPLGNRVAVIGNGNVAMDVVRLLCKPEAALVGTDVHDERLNQLRREPIKRIDILGRSPAPYAKFDLSMFKELLALPNIHVSSTSIRASDTGKIVEAFAHLSCSTADAIQVHFHFGVALGAIRHDSSGVCINATTANKELLKLQVDTVISAIGFTNDREAGDMEDWTGSNVFKVGWINRAGQGAIAENRKDAKAVAESIFTAFDTHQRVIGKAGFRAVEVQIPVRAVDFDGWKKIDRHELNTAAAGRCRRKITDISLMLDIAHEQEMTSIGEELTVI